MYSRLVVSQVEGSFKTKYSHMSQYLKLLGILQACFRKVSVTRVLRSPNSHSNSLTTLASSLDERVLQMISIELLEQSSIEHRPVVELVSLSEPSWIDPYVSFLTDGSLPTDTKKAEKVQRTSSHFGLSVDKKLYWQSFRGPYPLSLHPNDVAEFLVELHEGICDGNLGGRSLSHRTMTQGFWWPNMQ